MTGTCYCLARSGGVVVLVIVVVVLDFTTLLTSQVIGVAFYSERGKSDKFCSDALGFRLEVLLRSVNLRY